MVVSLGGNRHGVRVRRKQNLRLSPLSNTSQTILSSPHVRLSGFSHAVLWDERPDRRWESGRCGPPELCKGRRPLRHQTIRLIIVQGLPWSYPVDAFGFGCFVLEIHVGRLVFPATDSFPEKLSVLEGIVGMFSDKVIDDIQTVYPSTFTDQRPRLVKTDSEPGSRNKGKQRRRSSYGYWELTSYQVCCFYRVLVRRFTDRRCTEPRTA